MKSTQMLTPAEATLVVEARESLAWSRRKIRHCLGQLSDAQAWWRPRDRQNSVANLVYHLCGNLSQRLLSLIGGAPDERDRPHEFARRDATPASELLAHFDSVAERVDALLARVTPADLAKNCSYPGLAGPLEGSGLAVIYRAMTHLVGHTQEIIFMTRLQLGDAYISGEPAGRRP